MHSPAENSDQFRSIVGNLPAALYATDADGVITYFNDAAADLWGRRPVIREDKWCGSWRLYWPDGRRLPHDECPMAITVKTGKPIRGAEAIAERPDGSRFPFTPFPTPLFDSDGKLTGAINMLVEISGRKVAEEAAQRLAAVAEASDAAIIATTCGGVITGWNSAAERMFGYAASEIIGRHVVTLIPNDRHATDDEFVRRAARGESIERRETVRQHKDGTPVDVSLSVTPVHGADGSVIGVSKIARNITDRKRAENQIQRHDRRLARWNRISHLLSRDHLIAILFDNATRSLQRRDDGLSSSQWAVLRYLSKSTRARDEQQIVGYVGATGIALTRDLSLLMRHGFVARAANDLLGVTITDRGRAALPLDPLKRLARAIGRLGDERSATFAECLEIITGRLADDDGEPPSDR